MSKLTVVFSYPDKATLEEAMKMFKEQGDSSCYCSACSMPPCSHCEGSGTHEGHPLSLVEDNSLWEPKLVSAVRQIKEFGSVEFEDMDIPS